MELCLALKPLRILAETLQTSILRCWYESDVVPDSADWDWSEDKASWAGCPDTEEAVRADHAAAMDWYRQAKMRGEDIHAVSLEAPLSPSSECLAQKSVQ